MRILSGVFEDERTGGPGDHRHADLADDRQRRPALAATIPTSPTTFRPGHADYAYFAKYGVRDYRGGGRQSARETAARVAAGAVARKVLGAGVDRPRGAWSRSARIAVDRARWDWDETAGQSLLVSGRRRWSRSGRSTWRRCARPARPPARSSRSRPSGVPAGWGAPIYGKLDAEIAAALMSINAAKGVEIGAGFAAAALSRRGERRRDADGQRRRRSSCPTTPAASSAASPPASRWSRGWRSSRPPRSSRPAARSTRPAPRSKCAPPAATTPASASAPRRWSRRCWPACWPTPSCAIARQTGGGAVAPGGGPGQVLGSITGRAGIGFSDKSLLKLPKLWPKGPRNALAGLDVRFGDVIRDPVLRATLERQRRRRRLRRLGAPVAL